ncbi:hypothetical protein P171DRAFT_437193 [Karstenula rhodostoma CBS 690.94]|uniref:DUF3835 domain-containing protein n=1 Tax=Karstenula rhodostoma CBS 690.94 TaxID=1392251 RepID=A0A9P4U5V4_9PLEO|nr:hypothetical protein P171DRAFT_437193 [Karstenula rhodostoma CBS 690.94]
MATTAQQTMESVESRRLQLEETVAKFRKALDHWSTWEMEYQILKEELQAAGSPSPSEMAQIGHDMHGQLVNEKEVKELLGKDSTSQRTANQVIDMISRRLDYVGQNRDSVEKQFDKAQKQLEALEMLTDQGLETEEGLPMMDIEERLDDDDNVVSSSVTQPGKVAPELVEALRKAGVHKSEQKKPNTEQDSSDELSTLSEAAPSSEPAPAPTLAKTSEKSSPPSTSSKGKSKASEVPKKSVSFANDVQVETFEKPKTLKDDVRNWNLPPGAKVYEMDAEAEDSFEKAIVPDTDTPEEAALRQEMLQYGLSEVNDVVAELNLETDDEHMEDDYDEDYDGYDSEISEEEDKFGRSTRRVLSDDYVQEMRELEKKLNARMLENVGPNSELLEKAGDARTLRVRNDDEFEQTITTATPSDASTSKKGVRFAGDAAIPDAPQPAAQPSVPIKLPPTISETIVERAPSVPQSPSASIKPAKQSRFKSARATTNGPPAFLPTPAVPEPPPVPTGPKGSILASTVAEHTPHPSEPQVPDELDPVIHNREITAEYHKLRNKMIQQQGGFNPTEEDELDPLVEERNGQTKRVSRFKAAKLKAEGL